MGSFSLGMGVVYLGNIAIKAVHANAQATTTITLEFSPELEQKLRESIKASNAGNDALG